MGVLSLLSNWPFNVKAKKTSKKGSANLSRSLRFEVCEPRLLLAGDGFRVVLDPGHGGISIPHDSSGNNATGIVSGQLEKNLALDMSLLVQQKLQQRGFSVARTRTTDVNVTWFNRANMAATFGADFFLSIHYNAASKKENGVSVPDLMPRGTETWIQSSSTNVNFGDDFVFADNIDSAVAAAIPGSSVRSGSPKQTPKGWGTAYDPSLGNTTSNHPVISAFLEVDFITNPNVDQYVTSATGRDAIAEAIADGIQDTRDFFFSGALPAPNLTSPGNGSTGQLTQPTFNWSNVPSATTYRVVAATNPNDLPTNANPNFLGQSVVVNGTTSSSSLLSPSILNQGTQYYWTVRAGNATQGGLWAVRDSFTTAQSDTTLPTVVSTSPSNGSTLSSGPSFIDVNFSEAMAQGTGSVEKEDLQLSGSGRGNATVSSASWLNSNTLDSPSAAHGGRERLESASTRTHGIWQIIH